MTVRLLVTVSIGDFIFMPKYMTWEPSRNRWVFQIRIPEFASAAFAGRSAIRQHLGDIPEAEARAKATQLAHNYKTIFERHRPVGNGPGIPVTTNQPEQLLLVDRNIIERFVATWRWEQAKALEARLDDLRKRPAADWDALEAELRATRSSAKEALRRRRNDFLEAVRGPMETRYRIRLQGDAGSMEELACTLNAERMAFLEQSLAIVDGSKGVESLYPDPQTLLPLQELWGDAPGQLLERWDARIRSINGTVNPKTRVKYQAIIRDVDFLLGRRPIQSLTKDDVEALKTLWSSRGNGDTTIIGKLNSLRSLLRPFDPTDRFKGIFHCARPARKPSGTRRLPFSQTQFAALLRELHSGKEADLMLVMLIFLLACRVEEAYQLGACDFASREYGWLVRLADHGDTGSGSARLKTSSSARHLPLRSRDFPELHAWLRKRIAEGGDIFPTGSRNRYGIRSGAAGKRINRLIQQLFPKDGRLVLQSLRNTASRVMRQADVDPRIRRRFLGHADDGIHDRHYDPARLLDARDLEPGSVALASFLLPIVGT